MKVHAVQTPIFYHGMNLAEFVLEHAGQYLKEKSVLVVASKIVSVSENRTCPIKQMDKKQLVQQESDHYLGTTQGFHLTIKHQLLVPSAGIDESNSENGDYILYPKDPFASVKTLATQIKNELSLKSLGIIMADSRSFPLRRGVVGVALAYTGFQGIKSLVGETDLFGQRVLRVTKINLIDGLAAAAVLLMGEGGESRPLAIIDEIPLVFTQDSDPSEMHIPLEEDLYYPLYQHLLQKKNKL